MSFVEKKFKRKLKNEKGSITIFVLTAMLFFLIVIAGIFIFYSNKAVNHEKTMSGIKDEYSADNIDEIYNQKTNEDVVIPGTVVERPAGWPDNETVTPVTDGKDNIIPIPDDFYYAGGTKDTGFVISDVEGDDLQNSKKGNQLFEKIEQNTICKEEDFEEAVKYNPSMISSVKMHKNRENFFKGLENNDLEVLVKKYTKIPLYRKILRKSKAIVKKIIKK